LWAGRPCRAAKEDHRREGRLFKQGVRCEGTAFFATGVAPGSHDEIDLFFLCGIDDGLDFVGTVQTDDLWNFTLLDTMEIILGSLDEALADGSGILDDLAGHG
jgi:hypothetical protein